MRASLGVARLGPRLRGRPHDRQVVAWSAFAAGFGIAAIGTVGDSPPLIVLGGVLVASLGAVLAPQLLLAIFLVAGGLKTSPALSGLPIDLTILTAGGVMVAVILRAMRPDGVRSFPPATVLGVGVAAIVVVSVLWAPDARLGLDKALRFETFTMIAFFAPLVLVRTRGDLKRLMIFLVLASLAIALTAVPGSDPTEPLTVAGGQSEIELALYSSSGLVAIVGYLMLVPGSRLRILWLLPAALLANTVIAAGSRGVLLGTILALLVIGAAAAIRARVKAVPIAIMAGAVAVIVLFGSQIVNPAAQQKYEGLLAGGDAPKTLGKRNFLVQDGVEIALEHPMGIGAGGYQVETGFAYPHNAFVEIAAEQGVIGLALLGALMIAAFRSILRAREGPLSPEAILAGGLLIVLVSDAMVSQTFTQFRELWFALGLALAVPWIRASEADEQPVAPRPTIPPGPQPAHPSAPSPAPA